MAGRRIGQGVKRLRVWAARWIPVGERVIAAGDSPGSKGRMRTIALWVVILDGIVRWRKGDEEEA